MNLEREVETLRRELAELRRQLAIMKIDMSEHGKKGHPYKNHGYEHTGHDRPAIVLVPTVVRMNLAYTVNPANPPTNQAELIIIDSGASPVFRVRYNDAGTVVSGDLALV